MELSQNKLVHSFLEDLKAQSQESYDIVNCIRKIFFEFDEDLTEDIKYGGIVFFMDTVLIGGIYVYAKHISIEFSVGVKLSDPNGFLEGKGKYRRHLKIEKMDDVNKKKVKYYIQQILKIWWKISMP